MRHDQVPGVFAHIDVDGFRLEEFEEVAEAVEYEENPTARYIEAVAGSTFTVGVTFTAEFPYQHNDIECKMYLDGKRVSGKVKRSGHNHISFVGCSEVKPSGTYIRKFQFSELKTHDGGVQENQKEAMKNLGTISIKVFRCVKVASRLSCGRHRAELGRESVPEKGLKGRAISAQATLGAPERIAPRHSYHVEYPHGKQPLAVFAFKYRSHRDLQVEGIIPRSPSPVPLEERDPATLSNEELRQLLERRNEEAKAVSQIKREKRERSPTFLDDEDDNGEVTITGSSSKRRRTSPDSGVDLIDLTED